MQQEWFSSWFDSDYYHLLYKNRNEEEADAFIQKLILVLKLPKYAETLDVACGKGRHSITLNECGMHVTGVDLSANSIEYARQFENDTLHFAIHDMRNSIGSNIYDGVFNLFTSFGYFATEHDNKLAANTLILAAKKGGWIVIDFLNADMVRNMLAEKMSAVHKEVEGVDFQFEKYIQNNKVIKDIIVKENEKTSHFKEEVSLIDKQQFESYFGEACELIHCYGDYQLNAFNENDSPRLILIYRKK
jgi:SAM-dependent methyltransferase